MEIKTFFSTGQVLLKLAIIAFIALLMLIPISQIESLIKERQSNKEQVVDSMERQWGGRQDIRGPILVLPYLKSDSTTTEYAYFLPEKLEINGSLTPEERSRGIYKVLCYQSHLEFKGVFNFPDIANLSLKENRVQWDNAFFVIGVTEPASITNKLNMKINNKETSEVGRKYIADLSTSALTTDYPINPEKKDEKLNFDFTIDTKGLEALYLSPGAKESSVSLQSTWKDVAFGIDFLPNTRDINDSGFVAKWDMYDYNSLTPQMWKMKQSERPTYVGVELRTSVDHYQMILRSVKYALLFIVLTYSVFFLAEVICRSKIHPIQYILIGFALVLFYSLLLSVSEFLGFGIAYFIAGLATIALISVFSYLLLKKRKPTIFISSFLVVLYVFLYVVLQLEDMALLIGTIGLFIVLALIMVVSAKVDWNIGAVNKSRVASSSTNFANKYPQDQQVVQDDTQGDVNQGDNQDDTIA